MTQPDTLHDRIRAEIDRRMALTRRASPGPWRHFVDRVVRTTAPERAKTDAVAATYDVRDTAYIALHDPADAIRRYEGELEVLERHRPDELTERSCRWCYVGQSHKTGADEFMPWPCDEARSLAHRLGVSVDG